MCPGFLWKLMKKVRLSLRNFVALKLRKEKQKANLSKCETDISVVQAQLREVEEDQGGF